MARCGVSCRGSFGTFLRARRGAGPNLAPVILRQLDQAKSPPDAFPAGSCRKVGAEPKSADPEHLASQSPSIHLEPVEIEGARYLVARRITAVPTRLVLACRHTLPHQIAHPPALLVVDPQGNVSRSRDRETDVGVSVRRIGRGRSSRPQRGPETPRGRRCCATGSRGTRAQAGQRRSVEQLRIQ